MGVWVISFACCVEACASWNARTITPQCAAVYFDYSNTEAFVENSGLGNCFVKDSGSTVGHTSDITSNVIAHFSLRRRWR